MAGRKSIYDASIKLLKVEPEISKATVINDVGDFAHIITIRNREFHLTLQIPKTISEDNQPLVSLQAPETSNDNCLQIADELQRISVDHLSSPDLPVRMYSHAQNSLAGIPLSLDVHKDQQAMKPTKDFDHYVQKHNKVRKRDGEEKKKKKKVAMKTAEEVVKRVQWDDKIPTDDISIGYLDRFKGIQEKAFSSFSWEDIASVDYFTFAIPKHRIQYFKYKRCIVWDKTKRLDNVFGSTGSGKTIYDEINNYREEDYSEQPPAASEQAKMSEHIAPAAVDVDMDMGDNFAAYGRSESESEEYSETDDDDDDDDGVVVTVKDRDPELFSDSGEEDLENVDGAGAAATQEYWRDKLRPNFFICIRVTDDDVRGTVSRLQDMVVENEPRYESCCVPESMLHITLCTLRLNDAEEASHCLQVMKKFSDELRSSLPTSPLKIAGLDRFFHRVLFAKVHHGDDFLPFVEHLCTILRSEGIRIMDHHDFVPHMTVMKISRPVSRAMGTKVISPFVYCDFADVELGEQKVNSIYLCSMEKTRGPDGFYISPGSITFMKEEDR